MPTPLNTSVFNRLTIAVLLVFCMACTPVFITATEAFASDEKPIPADTARNLSFAKKYRTEGRYELARQHYLLALATCNTTTLRDTIQRDLQTLELQIRTLR